MNSNRFHILRDAAERFTLRFMLQQIGLGLLVFILGVLWLRIPDANALYVIATVVCGLFVIAVAGCGQSWLLLKLTNHTPTRARLLRGTGILLIAAVLWFLTGPLLDRLQVDNSLRAGYLNSRFPHSLRNVFSYSHIYSALNGFISILRWIVAALLASFAFKIIVSPRPFHSLFYALRSLTYWLVTVCGAFAAVYAVSFFTSWTPGHGIVPEFISLILRLIACILIAAGIVCFILATLAVLQRKVDVPYETPAGTPDTSHPRTTANP